MPKIEVTLSASQKRLLREADANGGVIHVGDHSDAAERKSAKALVRQGMLSCGNPRGYGWHHVTGHAREWLARAEQGGSEEST